MTDEKLEYLENMAYRIRLKVVDMAHNAGRKGAHLASALSSVEIFAVLYGEILNHNVDDPGWDGRDRFISGKEHGRLSEYAALYETGFLTKKDLGDLNTDGNRLAGHPLNISMGLEYSCCSLGMALPVAVGVALNAKIKKKDYRVYSIIGDGELDEESVWEALMAAAHYKLNNLVLIIDRNQLSSDGPTEEIMALGNLKEKLQAFGWNCNEVTDGNDVKQLLEAFEDNDYSKPFALIANTVKGKGVSFVENVPAWHHGILTDEQYKLALDELKSH